MSSIVNRYGFSKPPDPKTLTETPLKIAFELGSYAGPLGSPIAVNLTIHEDGFVAETRSSTDDADSFLHDVLTYVEKEFSLPSYLEVGVKKIYASEIYFHLPKALSIFNTKFSKVAETISLGNSGDLKPTEPVALIFGTDPARGRQSLLRIEREVNIPFSEGRYYSFAPLKTKEHLQLLEAFEASATS
ncbi:MAG: hypothetical protein ABSG12_13200 [Steroidobacteraceae bacterium]